VLSIKSEEGQETRTLFVFSVKIGSVFASLNRYIFQYDLRGIKFTTDIHVYGYHTNTSHINFGATEAIYHNKAKFVLHLQIIIS